MGKALILVWTCKKCLSFFEMEDDARIHNLEEHGGKAELLPPKDITDSIFVSTEMIDQRNKRKSITQEIPPIPRPQETTWKALFDWYYAFGMRQKMTLRELATEIGYSYGTVRNHKQLYDAEFRSM